MYAARPAAQKKVAGSSLYRLLCSYQSSVVVMSPKTSHVRKEFSLLGFTLLLPWAGGEGSLERAAIASCCSYGSASSCCTTAVSYAVETPEMCFLSSRRQSRISLQPGPAQQGDNSALPDRLAACGWCGVRLSAWTGKTENSTRCKTAMCWKDWQWGQDVWDGFLMKSNLYKLEQKLDLLQDNMLSFSY